MVNHFYANFERKCGTSKGFLTQGKKKETQKQKRIFVLSYFTTWNFPSFLVNNVNDYQTCKNVCKMVWINRNVKKKKKSLGEKKKRQIKLNNISTSIKIPFFFPRYNQQVCSYRIIKENWDGFKTQETFSSCFI